MMKEQRPINRVVVLFLILFVFSGGVSLSAHQDKAVHPQNVIMYIGDGMGSVQRRLAETVTGKTLVMNTLPIVGMFTNTPVTGKSTRAIAKQMKISEDALKTYDIITDSAASGTALATGRKTENYAISIGPERKVTYQTLAEAAKRMGKSVGLISTTTITDATPAAFGAHVTNRLMQNKVVEQFLEQDFEVLMGGGWQHFVPKSVKGSARRDERDLLKDFTDKGYTIVRSKQDLAAIDIQMDTKILGLFSTAQMPYYLDRTEKEPDLSLMVDIAIKLLSQNPEGFFLMVEGARIDHAGHANDPGGVVGDLLELDKAVKTGVDFIHNENPDTLLLVCADHETGGLALGADTNYFTQTAIIKGIKHSIEWLTYVLLQTPEKAIETFSENTGISDLTKEEIGMLEKAIAPAKASKSHIPSEKEYGKGSELSPVIAKIINKRIGIGWTTFGHTAMPIMITATGPGAVAFTGYYDQTEVAAKIADLWGTELKSWSTEKGME